MERVCVIAMAELYYGESDLQIIFPRESVFLIVGLESWLEPTTARGQFAPYGKKARSGEHGVRLCPQCLSSSSKIAGRFGAGGAVTVDRSNSIQIADDGTGLDSKDARGHIECVVCVTIDYHRVADPSKQLFLHRWRAMLRT